MNRSERVPLSRLTDRWAGTTRRAVIIFDRDFDEKLRERIALFVAREQGN